MNFIKIFFSVFFLLSFCFCNPKVRLDEKNNSKYLTEKYMSNYMQNFRASDYETRYGTINPKYKITEEWQRLNNEISLYKTEIAYEKNPKNILICKNKVDSLKLRLKEKSIIKYYYSLNIVENKASGKKVYYLFKFTKNLEVFQISNSHDYKNWSVIFNAPPD